jgi:lincosamide nucleotidyltransferase A/C/D/E
VRASDVVRVLDLLGAEGVRCWVDGGWGVDALLGVQSRPHSDLDLVVVRSHLELALGALRGEGFEVTRDWLPNAVALRDGSGREVDLHPVDTTADGGGDQVLLDGESTWHYSSPVEGSVGGRAVLCCSPDEQLLMHQGYQPRECDVADVKRLAAHFRLPLPEPYSGVT